MNRIALGLLTAAAGLLGDAFGAKNDVGRVAILVFLLGGNVVFALVFGEVCCSSRTCNPSLC